MPLMWVQYVVLFKNIRAKVEWTLEKLNQSRTVSIWLPEHLAKMFFIFSLPPIYAPTLCFRTQSIVVVHLQSP